MRISPPRSPVSAARHPVVVCYGDGNTHGVRASVDPADRQRYRRAVRWSGRLALAYQGGVRVLCEGLPGRTTVHDDPIEGAHKNGLMVLPAILESHAPVDVVILMLGTEDLKARFAVTSADIALSVDRLLGVVRTSGCGPQGGAPRVLLIAPPPIAEIGRMGGYFAGATPISEDLARRYAEVATRWDCDFLDAGQVAEVDPVDGVHLSEAGHAALAQAVMSKLAAMFGSHDDILSLPSARRHR